MTQVSLCTYSTGSDMVREVLEDWLAFAGPSVDEVVVAVSSEGDPPAVYRELKAEGKIDKLIEIQAHGREVQDIDAAAIVATMRAASHRFALLVKMDTLPWREGHDDWLTEAIERVKAGGHFGFTGSFPIHDPTPVDPPGYYLTARFSHNFAVVDPARYVRVVHERCGPWVLDPLSTAPGDHGHDRYYAERAVEEHLQETGERCLYRAEEPDWTVFHINQWADQLRQVREHYRARRAIRRHLNRPVRRLPHYKWEHYYGYPVPSLWRRLRIRLGAWRRSLMGPASRD